MSKTGMVNFGKKVLIGAGKYAPQALTGMSAGGTVAGIFLAVKAGMEFQKLKDSGKDITWQDYIRIFVPPAAAGVFSIACGFAGLSKMEQRYAAAALLANTYELTQKEFDEKAKEIFGEGKAEKLHDEVNKAYMKQHPLTAQQIAMVDGTSNVWIIDKFSGSRMISTVEDVKAKVNIINERINEDRTISYNDYLDTLGFPSDLDAVEEYSFNKDTTGLISLRYTFDSLDGRTPVCILEHENSPRLMYDIDEMREMEARLPGWADV